jgi:hypothetical protein
MRDVGSREVILDLAVRFKCRDNSDSLVRWMKQPDGGYKYDFTNFDKYLDLVAAKLGKPYPLRLNLWAETYSGNYKEKELDFEYAWYVTTLDPVTGKLDKLKQPMPGTPEPGLLETGAG